MRWLHPFLEVSSGQAACTLPIQIQYGPEDRFGTPVAPPVTKRGDDVHRFT
jgi:hypothetical protein